MEWFLNLISNDAFIQFISTFGLAVVIVVYFVFYRDPKHVKFWQGKYAELSASYGKLSENYGKLQASLDPEKRQMSKEQALKLNYIALDRDLYKLYYYCCQKIDGKRADSISAILKKSILDTNDTWSQFTTPFPRVPCITDLYGVYKNGGANLKKELQKIIGGPKSEQEKKDLIWNKFLKITVDMKDEFSTNLQRHYSGEAVEPYEARQRPKRRKT